MISVKPSLARSRPLPITLALSLALLLTACEDPAKAVPKATTDSAKPVPASSSPAPSAGSPRSTASPTAATPPPTSTAPVAAPDRPAGALDLSPASSKIEFTGSKVTGKQDGKFEKFSGWIALDGDKPERAKVYLEIDVASLKTDSAKLDGHLKTDAFFFVEQFPTATFVTTEIKPGGDGGTYTVTGNLRMRGVEKSVSFPAKLEVKGGGATAVAEFAINRKDWGIMYAGKSDDLIRDDVVIRLDLSVKK